MISGKGRLRNFNSFRIYFHTFLYILTGFLCSFIYEKDLLVTRTYFILIGSVARDFLGLRCIYPLFNNKGLAIEIVFFISGLISVIFIDYPEFYSAYISILGSLFLLDLYIFIIINCAYRSLLVEISEPILKI